jgi:hypothetical protein
MADEHQNFSTKDPIKNRKGSQMSGMIQAQEITRDVRVSEVVNQELIRIKFSDHYTSLDEVLRAKLGLPAGRRPFLKGYPSQDEHYGRNTSI